MEEISENSESEEIWVTEFDTSDAIAFNEKVMAHVKAKPSKPLVIYIKSYGGMVDSLFSMIDTLGAARSKADKGFYIVTAIQGMAMSAGAVLATCGDYRFASPNSRIMLHQIIGAAWGEKRNIDIQKDELDRLNETVLQILLDNCKIKGGRRKLQSLLDRDRYFTPQEAKANGIIDVIGTPHVVEVTGYKLAALNTQGAVNVSKRTTR